MVSNIYRRTRFIRNKFLILGLQPFVGASGVHHPILAEAVTQFQAQAYKEMLPAGGPVDTEVLGMTDNAKNGKSKSC